MTESLAEALAELQSKLPVIAKQHTARVQTDKTSFAYEFADLADVSEALLPLMGPLGLSFVALPTMRDGDFVLHYRLLHTSGESAEGFYPLPKSGTPQAMGAAITYGRRYCLCAATGAAPKGDDNDAADQPKTRTAQRARPTQQPAQQGTPRPTAQRAHVDGPPLPGDPGSDGASEAQVKMIGVLMNKVGMTDRALALEFVASVIGREVESRNELTKGEASQVIDELQKQAQPIDVPDTADPSDIADPWAKS